jgi:hypothetical protein
VQRIHAVLFHQGAAAFGDLSRAGAAEQLRELARDHLPAAGQVQIATGPGPLSLDELWRACLARSDIEHAFRTLKGMLGLTAAKVRAPEEADRWARLLMAAHAQLLLARPLAAGLRRPWEKHPDPARPLAPGRVRRGFRNIRRDLGTPARVAKPSRPGPGRPKGSSKGPAPRHLLPGEADMPRTTNTTLTRQKVKT